MRKITDHPEFYLPAAFLVARFILFLSLTDEGLRGYGDLVHFITWQLWVGHISIYGSNFHRYFLSSLA